MSDYLDYAREVFEIESRAVAALAGDLSDAFNRAVDAILGCSGKVVVCGMGKSGLVGRKVSATLASTGTPSFFMHPGEAFHGDLGMAAPGDVVLGLSNSGETEEILRLAPFFKSNGNFLISMTSNPDSTLAQHSDAHLLVRVAQEACPLQLAPTSSTTAALVMGDALAVALMKARGFTPEGFARFHPGGQLGRKLLTDVSHVMVKGSLPVVDRGAGMKEVITVVTRGRLGLAVVVEEGVIEGIITDGDLRRAMESFGDLFFLKAADIMTENPQVISPDLKLVEAEEIMNRRKITSLLVAEEGNLVGIVQIYKIYADTQ